jgi:signal transduction histidine kinase
VSVRVKIALTIFITGLLTAIGVIATVAVAFERLERETTFERANVFLGRVVATYDNLLDLHDRYPEDLNTLLRNLLLFEANSELYLLSGNGVVLSSTGKVPLPAGFAVAMATLREAAQSASTDQKKTYVLGIDPERTATQAVVAARALDRAAIRKSDGAAGYLYLVTHKDVSPQGRLAVFRSAFAGPALVAVSGVVALATLMAAWIITTVIRPLRRISAEVARASREGLGAASLEPSALAFDPLQVKLPRRNRPDEFDQLREGFHAMLSTLRQQWQALRELDHFRREGVSNLSHDLRSPLTATVACLETLDQRWATNTNAQDHHEDRRLIAMALRNTRNAAQLVRSLGDLAQLDEPEFKMHLQPMNLGEMLDDISMRFTERAQQRGVTVRCDHDEQAEPTFADVDIELLERALGNLMDNALRYTPAGGQITLSTRRVIESATRPSPVELSVRDDGAGIAENSIPHLFDRHYKARTSVAPASSEGGKGLGLAIVKRIAELHSGSVAVHSTVGSGTLVVITLPGR